ncbi:MAG TPA: CoA pyrophosphatase [Rhodocyclaceae bacterium]|nr:CoA pyrophosphatase [Rhodocyclaceae bacterium]
MASLTAAWLRQRFAAVAPSMPGKPQAADPALVPAAVLVPIVLRASALTILLTQRTAHLRDHAGQISFPGGRCEPEDDSPVATALREAHEEVGLDPVQVEILGTLTEYRTGTGFTVQPVVGLVAPPLNLKLDDFEVEDVFEPPLEFLLQPANFRRERAEYQGAMREYWAVPWQERYIWGATAGMLVSLREFLFSGV